MKFDIFITAAPKDYNKLPYVLSSIHQNIKGFDEIIICSPTEIYLDVKQVRDKDILDIDLSKINYRSKWIYQQFLKLFQFITENEFYLTIDADTIINKPLDFFCGSGFFIKPIWYKGWDQNHQPYYNFNKQILGYERSVNHTFLADMNFFDRTLIYEMLWLFKDDNSYNSISEIRKHLVNNFIEKSVSVITNSCYPSEADLYGNFVFKEYPDLYQIRQLKTDCKGKFGEWTKEEIEERINIMKNTDFDTFSLHSWT